MISRSVRNSVDRASRHFPNPPLTELRQNVPDPRPHCETAGEPRGWNLQHAPRGGLRETDRARPASPEKPTKTAGQSPFTAGSRIATHSTCDVIGNMSLWAQTVKQQVRVAFESRSRVSGRPERQMSVTAVRRFGTGNWRGYPRYGSTSTDTEPHTVDTRRCAYFELAARQSVRGSVSVTS